MLAETGRYDLQMGFEKKKIRDEKWHCNIMKVWNMKSVHGEFFLRKNSRTVEIITVCNNHKIGRGRKGGALSCFLPRCATISLNR